VSASSSSLITGLSTDLAISDSLNSNPFITSFGGDSRFDIQEIYSNAGNVGTFTYVIDNSNITQAFKLNVLVCGE
jgi:hypothetical protein